MKNPLIILIIALAVVSISPLLLTAFLVYLLTTELIKPFIDFFLFIFIHLFVFSQKAKSKNDGIERKINKQWRTFIKEEEKPTLDLSQLKNVLKK